MSESHHHTIGPFLGFRIAFYSVEVMKEEEIKVVEIRVQKKIW